MRRSSSVVITGTSTGIGFAAAKLFAERGWRVFASVRRQEDAERLRDTIAGGVTPLLFDVTDAEAVRRAASLVREELDGRRLGGLVNNAGIAMGGMICEQAIAEFELHLKINVAGAFSVTQAFLPLLGMDDSLAGGKGRVVNISSPSGRLGIPITSAYVSSKHALEGFSSSLRREVQLFGIEVVVVDPGHVVTPIWDKAEERGAKRPDGPYTHLLNAVLESRLRMGRNGKAPEEAAETIWKALTTSRPRLRYEPLRSKLLRLTPARMMDRAMKRRLERFARSPRR